MTAAPAGSPGVSVLVLTRNEERDLPGCLDSVAWCDDIHVYDSLSEDGTLRIARERGALVTTRRFDDWASHQNWGLRHIPFRHPWVLYLDADERVTPALADAVREAVARRGPEVAFRVRRRDHLDGTWLRHVQATPWYLRLFRPGHLRYERLVNPASIVDGPIGTLTGDLDHFPFSKGIAHWLARHNDYSGLEARQWLAERAAGPKGTWLEALSATDFHERRRHQKALFYRLPARPLIRFAYLYGVRRGFLDGRAGLSYALLQAFYELMIVLKVRELQRADRLLAASSQPLPRPDPSVAADAGTLPPRPDLLSDTPFEAIR